VRAAVFGVAFMLVASACGGFTPVARSGPYATFAWSTRPLAPDPAFTHQAYQACVINLAMLPPKVDRVEVPPAVEDHRGPDIGLFVWADATGEGTCMVVRQADGQLAVVSGSAVQPGSPLGDRLQATNVADTPPLFVAGESGPATRVLIDLADGTSFEASTANGRFAAWWPSMTAAVQLRSFDAAGNLVETYRITPYQPHQ
jgi:hypothetical protein